MSVFDRYNFELPRTIMASLKPVKELPPPFFVRVETEVYKQYKYFVKVIWHERFQEINTMHVFDRNVFILTWDTTDYTAMGLPEQEPELLNHYVLSLDKPAQRVAFEVLIATKFEIDPEFVKQAVNFQAIVWRLLNRPLWERLQYEEKIIENKKIMTSEKLKRLGNQEAMKWV